MYKSLEAAIATSNERIAKKLIAIKEDLIKKEKKHNEDIEELKKNYAKI